eukprot:3801380-Karenia_brevis.AAC.1
MVRNPIRTTSTPITPGPMARSSTVVTMPYPMTDVRLPPSARGVVSSNPRLVIQFQPLHDKFKGAR